MSASTTEVNLYFLWFGLTLVASVIPIFLNTLEDAWESAKGIIFCTIAMLGWWILATLHIYLFIDSNIMYIGVLYVAIGFVFLFLDVALILQSLIPNLKNSTQEKSDEKIFEM
jgi:hypothetical protein